MPNTLADIWHWDAGILALCPDFQRQRGHHGQYCGACHAIGGPSHFVKECAGCYMVWYCNPECQKSHWKEHKPLCLAARASAPPRGESDGLLEWINRNKGPLNQAGNEVLLPSKDQPTRNRLDSHVLWVIVKPIIPLPSPSSDFEVILAGPRPIDRFKSMLDENRPGTFDYLRDFTLASPHAVEAGGGKPDGVAGVMWFAIECKEMKATTTVQLVIGRDMLEHRRETRVYLDRWLEELKAFTAPGVRTYGLGDYTLAVKKPNTRRQKQTAESVPAEQKARLRKLSIWK